MTIARGDLTFNGGALLARDRLLYTAKRSAELGAWCGLGGVLICLALVWCYEAVRGDRCMSCEPSRPRPGSSTSAPDAPWRVKARPVEAERGKAAPGGEDAPAPREREYGRWI